MRARPRRARRLLWPRERRERRWSYRAWPPLGQACRLAGQQAAGAQGRENGGPCARAPRGSGRAAACPCPRGGFGRRDRRLCAPMRFALWLRQMRGGGRAPKQSCTPEAHFPGKCPECPHQYSGDFSRPPPGSPPGSAGQLASRACTQFGGAANLRSTDWSSVCSRQVAPTPHPPTRPAREDTIRAAVASRRLHCAAVARRRGARLKLFLFFSFLR